LLISTTKDPTGHLAQKVFDIGWTCLVVFPHHAIEDQLNSNAPVTAAYRELGEVGMIVSI
jgi:hypothetical protein